MQKMATALRPDEPRRKELTEARTRGRCAGTFSSKSQERLHARQRDGART